LPRYATFDLRTGFICWVGDAKDAKDACGKSDLEGGLPPGEYDRIAQSDVSGGGYAVLVVPAGYEVEDGQNDDAIEALRKHPLEGFYRRVPDPIEDSEDE
jgi:hypothetical protein